MVQTRKEIPWDGSIYSLGPKGLGLQDASVQPANPLYPNWIEGPIEITRLHTRKAGETGLDGLNSSCFRSSGFTSNHHRSLLAGGVKTGFRFTGSCIKLTYIHLHATISLESGTFWYSEKNRDEGEDAMEMGKEGQEHYLNMNTLNYTILGCTWSS